MSEGGLAIPNEVWGLFFRNLLKHYEDANHETVPDTTEYQTPSCLVLVFFQVWSPDQPLSTYHLGTH